MKRPSRFSLSSTNCEPYSLPTSLQKLPANRYEGKKKEIFFTPPQVFAKLSYLEDPLFENTRYGARAILIFNIFQRHRWQYTFVRRRFLGTLLSIRRVQHVTTRRVTNERKFGNARDPALARVYAAIRC